MASIPQIPSMFFKSKIIKLDLECNISGAQMRIHILYSTDQTVLLSLEKMLSCDAYIVISRR